MNKYQEVKVNYDLEDLIKNYASIKECFNNKNFKSSTGAAKVKEKLNKAVLKRILTTPEEITNNADIKFYIDNDNFIVFDKADNTPLTREVINNIFLLKKNSFNIKGDENIYRENPHVGCFNKRLITLIDHQRIISLLKQGKKVQALIIYKDAVNSYRDIIYENYSKTNNKNYRCVTELKIMKKLLMKNKTNEKIINKINYTIRQKTKKMNVENYLCHVKAYNEHVIKRKRIKAELKKQKTPELKLEMHKMNAKIKTYKARIERHIMILKENEQINNWLPLYKVRLLSENSKFYKAYIKAANKDGWCYHSSLAYNVGYNNYTEYTSPILAKLHYAKYVTIKWEPKNGKKRKQQILKLVKGGKK